MEPIDLPHYVDDPPHVLIWSAEELAPVAIGMAVGMIAGQALLLTLLGLASAKVYRRFSDGRPDGFILHWLYWHGFIPSGSRTAPNPYIRRYMP